VLSDGQPTQAETGDAAWGLQTVVKELRATKKVEINAIGIFTDYPKRFYGPETECIGDLEELDAALLSTLRRSLG